MFRDRKRNVAKCGYKEGRKLLKNWRMLKSFQSEGVDSGKGLRDSIPSRFSGKLLIREL
jgi:hypothetical protein